MTAVASQSSAQGAADRGAFILIQRGDTVAIERFARTSDSLGVDLNIKMQAHFVYIAKLAPDFTLPRLAIQVYLPTTPPGAPPAQSAVLTMKGDSVIADLSGGGQNQTQRLKTVAGAVMQPPSSIAAFEQLTMKLRSTQRASTAAAPERSVTIPVFATAGGVTLNAVLTPNGADSVVVNGATQEYRLKVDPVGRILGGAAPAVGLLISRVDEATASRLAIGKPDYSAPAGAPYTTEEVTVTNGDVVLGGTLTRPTKASGRVPAVVTITGSGQQDRDEYIPIAGGYRPFREIADTLGRRGIAVLRLDDRGVGNSTGNPATSTSLDFANDIRAAVAYLRSRRDIDPARIALIGHSEGGLIAPLVAATDPKLKGIVLMAGPAYTGRQIITYQQQYALAHDTSLTTVRRDSLARVGAAQIDSLSARNPWVRFFLTYAPDTTARKVKVPVLILQGATDRQVTADQADKLAAAFRAGGNRDVTLRLFPDHNHLFITDPTGNPQDYARLPTNKVDPVVLGVLADWLATRLKP